MKAILLAALVVATAACTGSLVPTEGGGLGDDDDGDGSGAATARAKFDAEVKPILVSRCAACHAGAAGTLGPGNAPRLMGASEAEYYDALFTNNMINYVEPARSPLVARGLHFNGAAPAFDETTEMPKVVGWISLEGIERGATPDAGP
jgi:hypothetical protein